MGTWVIKGGDGGGTSGDPPPIPRENLRRSGSTSASPSLPAPSVRYSQLVQASLAVARMTQAVQNNPANAEMASFGIVAEKANVAEMAREKAEMATDSVQMQETAELVMVASIVTVLP